MIRSVDLHYSISGFWVSLLVGMTGVGGGSLMTPLLILLFGIHPATAVGTDLLYAAATKSAGTLVHGLNRSIDWQIVRRLAAGSVPVTALALLALSHFGVYSHAAHCVITGVLSGALAATAAVLIARRLAAGYRHRQLFFRARAGCHLAFHACRDIDPRCRQARAVTAVTSVGQETLATAPPYRQGCETHTRPRLRARCLRATRSMT